MFCKYCGYELEDDSLFCPQCGKNLDKEISTREVTPSVAKDKIPTKQKKNLGKKIAIVIIVIVAVRTIGRIAYTKTSTPKENKSKVENNSLALVQAVRSNSIDEVKRLINNGTDVNGMVKLGDVTLTPLTMASINGFTDVAKLLIDSGAYVNLRIPYSVNVDLAALDYAAMFNSLEIAQLLIEKGANIEAKDAYGSTALMYAARENAIDVAKLLIENGADINAKGSDGKTVLMHAKSSVDVAKLLINRGVKDDLTHVLFETAWESSSDVVKLLLDNGASVNARNADGYTVLMKVAAGNSIDVAKVLLKKGAKVTLVDNNGNTALHEAANYGRPNMSRLLSIKRS